MNDNGVSEFKQLVNREFDALTARVAELERERNEHWGVDTKLIAERDAARAKVEEMERTNVELMHKRGELKEELAERIKEIRRLKEESKQSQPDGLSAILRELREERIYGAIEFDKYGMNAIIKCIGDFDHSRSCETYEDVAANLTRLAIQYHPDSSFARRRAEATVEAVDENPRPWRIGKADNLRTPEMYDAVGGLITAFGDEDFAHYELIVAAVNAYQPPQPETSLSQETLVAIDRAVGTAIFQYTSGLMESLKKMDKEESAPPTPASPTPEPRLNAQQRAQPSINPADASGRYPLSGAVPVKPTPAAADPVRELLDAGEWSVKSEPYSSAYCVMAGNEFFCHCTNDDLDQFVALCTIVNRYRAIESAVNGSSFVRETIMSNLGGSTWESLHAALRPLLRTSEKEA